MFLNSINDPLITEKPGAVANLKWNFRSVWRVKNGLKKNISLSNRLGLAQKGHSLKIRQIFINLERIRGGEDLEAVYWGHSMGGIPSRRGGLVPGWRVAGEEERCAWADCNSCRAPSLSVKWRKPAGNHCYGVIICNMISGMKNQVLISLYMGDFWNVWINLGHENLSLSSHKLWSFLMALPKIHDVASSRGFRPAWLCLFSYESLVED